MAGIMPPITSSDVSKNPVSAETRRRIVFLLLPHVHLLDFSGPAQVFFEANVLAGGYDLEFCAFSESVVTAQGPSLAGLTSPPNLGPRDRIFVPGVDSHRIVDLQENERDWLRESYEAGVLICSVCTAAHVLGQAGLLDGRQCTTHWRLTKSLQEAFPAARVLENRLFVADEGVCTSAGIASGIDLALWLVERDHSPLVAAKVARELVVFLRRDGTNAQRSLYLDYRTHLHSGVHRIQDWLVSHPHKNPSLDELAQRAGMSPRNLTRVFRKATGITLKTFTTRLKLELAGHLMRNPDLTLEAIASQCGFVDARQLRLLWKRANGVPPSVSRQTESATA